MQQTVACCAHATAQYEHGTRLCEEMIHEMEMRRGLEEMQQQQQEEEEKEEEASNIDNDENPGVQRHRHHKNDDDNQDEHEKKRALLSALWIGRDDQNSDLTRPVGVEHQPQPWVYGHEKDAVVDVVSAENSSNTG